jgi:hypothetical protein
MRLGIKAPITNRVRHAFWPQVGHKAQGSAGLALVLLLTTAVHQAPAQADTSIKLFDATSAFQTGPVTSPAEAVPYASRSLILTIAPGDKTVISSTADGTGSIVIDNFLTINGANACQAAPGQGFPESCFVRQARPLMGGPIETVLIPIPPIDVSGLIPIGTNPVLFELRDFGIIAGNTDLYLVTTGTANLSTRLTPSPGALKKAFEEALGVCSDNVTTSTRAKLDQAFTDQITRPILGMLRSAGANPEKIVQTRDQLQTARQNLEDELTDSIEGTLKGVNLIALSPILRSSQDVRQMTGAPAQIVELKADIGTPQLTTTQSISDIMAGGFDAAQLAISLDNITGNCSFAESGTPQPVFAVIKPIIGGGKKDGQTTLKVGINISGSDGEIECTGGVTSSRSTEAECTVKITPPTPDFSRVGLFLNIALMILLTFCEKRLRVVSRFRSRRAYG